MPAALTSVIPQLLSVPLPLKRLAYGTAGFRDRAEVLHSTFFRMGALAALRSKQTGAVIGLMVTASHNPVADNGIKLVDQDGGLLPVVWETHATDLANATPETMKGVLEGIMAEYGICWDAPCSVYVGRDTRPHSAELSELSLKGARLAGAQGVDKGVLTTPQLHHIVRMRNGLAAAEGNNNRKDGSKDGSKDGRVLYNARPEWEGEEGYGTMLAQAFADLVATRDGDTKHVGVSLVVDGANGVGAAQFHKVMAQVNAKCGEGVVDVCIRNGVMDGELNEGCGAEFVHKNGKPPQNFSDREDRGKRLCSFDGDADRLVYHYFDHKGVFHLLDGDKIATLCADFLTEQVRRSGLPGEWSSAIVQTAYANGASTAYLRSRGVPVSFAKTGVKFLHHKAAHFDLGTYFEANGHGTVLFSTALGQAIEQHLAGLEVGSEAEVATRRLLLSRQLILQAVGDAMSDCLFVEAVLGLKGWEVWEWDAIYQDLPSRHLKVTVADRGAIVTNDDETRALQPKGLQDRLDAIVSTVDSGRAFVRPSGTEDIVRIYAEARTQELADELATKAAELTYDLAGGVGERPRRE